MFRILAFITFLGTTPMSAGTSPAEPSRLTASSCDFPETYSFTPAQCTIRLTNTSGTAIHVSDFRIPLAGSTANPEELLLEPYASADVRINVDSDGVLGKVDQVIRFKTNEGATQSRNTRLRGYVMSALDDARPKLDFGEVDVTQPPAFREVRLSSHELADFRVVRVVSAPAYLDARIGEDRRAVKARVRPDAPWGAREDSVKVEINSPHQQYAVIQVKANIHGDVAAPGNPLWFGFRQARATQELLVPLTSASGNEFSLGRLTVDNGDAKAEPADCDPPSKACKAVKVRWGASEAYGMRKMTLRVRFPPSDRELPIQLWGFLTHDGGSKAASTTSETKGRATNSSAAKLGGGSEATAAEEKRPRDKSEVSGQTGKPAENHLLSGGSNSADSPAGVAQSGGPAQAVLLPGGSGPLLKWSVTNEEALYGFQVFRADSEAGPYVLLNTPAIPVDQSQPDKLYQWRDTSAVKGNTYWYYVGVVYNDGRKERITPETKATAK